MSYSWRALFELWDAAPSPMEEQNLNGRHLIYRLNSLTHPPAEILMKTVSCNLLSALLRPSASRQFFAILLLSMLGVCNRLDADDLQPQFPGVLRNVFIYETAPFPECHASTICETRDGFVAAWFGGTEERDKDVEIWSSFLDGPDWSKPVSMASGVQHADLRYPCWNPVLFQTPDDQSTLLFFKVGPTPDSWWGELTVSSDQGRTFSNRRRLPEEILGPVRCKPILLKDNETLLCGSSTEHDGWRVHFEKIRLVDGIPTGEWKRIGPINDASEFNAIQPTLLTHADGRLQALCRTKENVIASTFSADDGKTWSKLVAIDLPNPNSGIEGLTLTDGRHLLVYNHVDNDATGWGRRGLLNLAISTDGLNWTEVGVLEQEKNAEFSYPAMIQAKDGSVHITYTWNRKRIKYVVVDPAQLIEK